MRMDEDRARLAVLAVLAYLAAVVALLIIVAAMTTDVDADTHHTIPEITKGHGQ